MENRFGFREFILSSLLVILILVVLLVLWLFGGLGGPVVHAAGLL